MEIYCRFTINYLTTQRDDSFWTALLLLLVITQLLYLLIEQFKLKIVLKQVKQGLFVLLNAVYMDLVTDTHIFNIHRFVHR